MKRAKCAIVDFGADSLRIRWRGRGLRVPLERATGGLLTPACRERVETEVRQFLGIGPRVEGKASSAVRALCAIGARGVSLRALRLPIGRREEARELIDLQVEREFPLPPSELAVSWYVYGGHSANGERDVLVAALRRETFDHDRGFLADCGLDADLVLGAVAACRVCELGSGHVAVLDVGRTHSELVDLWRGRPRSLRCLPWGGETVTEAVQSAAGVSRDEAERIKREAIGTDTAAKSADSSLDTDELTNVREAARSAVATLARQLRSVWAAKPAGPGVEWNGGPAGLPEHLVLVGGGARLRGIAHELERVLGGSVSCSAPGVDDGDARSAVIAGLEAPDASRTALPELCFRSHAAPTKRVKVGRRTSVVPWLVLAALLAAGSLALRFVPAYFEAPRLRERISALKTSLATQPDLAPEIAFLSAVERSRPEYVEAVAALALAAPPGSFFTEITFERQGSVTLRGRVKGPNELEQLRKKLVESGWFGRVVVQSQAPQKKQLIVHLTAELRKGKPVEPTEAQLGSPAKAGATAPGPRPSPGGPPPKPPEGGEAPPKVEGAPVEEAPSSPAAEAPAGIEIELPSGIHRSFRSRGGNRDMPPEMREKLRERFEEMRRSRRSSSVDGTSPFRFLASRPAASAILTGGVNES